mmetsp:Transcript_7738/g.23207  ORF Transcript_7738/g.23207 Transcript_7738/m.23207 type:complete len:261 (+) Transcript_7738:757-1539(+)
MPGVKRPRRSGRCRPHVARERTTASRPRRRRPRERRREAARRRWTRRAIGPCRARRGCLRALESRSSETPPTRACGTRAAAPVEDMSRTCHARVLVECAELHLEAGAVHPSCLTNHLPQSPSTSGVRARRSQKKAKSIPSWRASASSSPPATPHPSSLASVASSAASSSASWFTTPVFSRSRSSELSASRSRTASGSEPKAPNPPPRPLVLKVLAMNSSTNASASVSPPPSSCLRAATARTKATTRASRPFTACITPLLS